MQPTIRRWFAPTMLVLAALTGCGPQVDRPDVEYVEGIVTLDGKPLEAATVGLTPVSGGLPAYGNTDTAGVFKLTSSRGGLPGKGAVTALAIENMGKRREAVTGGHATGGGCDAHQKPRSHDTSRIAGAKLMARVGKEFPFACPNCGGIRLIAFITEPGPAHRLGRTRADP